MDAFMIALGIVALLAGGTLFLRSRRGRVGEGAGEAGLTNPTTLVIACSLLLLGYHLLAWTLPDRWFPLQIPLRLWPLLAGGVGVAIAGALVADALERRDAPSDAGQ